MEINLLYWHWILLGVILMLAEIFLASFFVLWFGVAAIITGIVLMVAPGLGLSVQLTLWTLLSVCLAIAWFKYLRPLAVDRTQAGLSREAIIGQTGQVIVVPQGEIKGSLRFPAPILGNDEWLIMTEDSVAVGDRVRVIEVSGNALIVTKA